MTELARHIEILLLNNDCVIVPGFGGFMAHHAVSVYNEEEGLFLPPSRTLGFNPQLQINDSLLAQSYIEAYDISYPEALRRIEDDVNELRQHIANEGECELQDIGVISVNEDGNYDFRPCLSGILTPSLYALGCFEMERLKNFKEVEDVTGEVGAVKMPLIPTAHEEPESQVEDELQDAEMPQEEEVSDVPDVEVTAEEETETAEEDTETKVITLRVDTLRRYAVAAAVLLLFILMAVPVGDMNHRNVQHCSIDSNMLTRIMPKLEVEGDALDFLDTEKTVKEEVVTLEEEPAAVAEEPVVVVEKPAVVFEKTAEVTEKPAEVTEKPAVKAPKENFVIVLACGVPQKNAEAYVEKLKAMGVNGPRVMKDRNMIRVVCGSFATENEARTAVNIVRMKPGLESAWVMSTAK